MTQSDWHTLEIGNRVSLVKNPNLVLVVSEVCVEPRFLQNWINRGIDCDRLIKFEREGDSFHTWSVSPSDWVLV